MFYLWQIYLQHSREDERVLKILQNGRLPHVRRLSLIFAEFHVNHVL